MCISCDAVNFLVAVTSTRAVWIYYHLSMLTYLPAHSSLPPQPWKSYATAAIGITIYAGVVCLAAAISYSIWSGRRMHTRHGALTGPPLAVIELRLPMQRCRVLSLISRGTGVVEDGLALETARGILTHAIHESGSELAGIHWSLRRILISYLLNICLSCWICFVVLTSWARFPLLRALYVDLGTSRLEVVSLAILRGCAGILKPWVLVCETRHIGPYHDSETWIHAGDV